MYLPWVVLFAVQVELGAQWTAWILEVGQPIAAPPQYLKKEKSAAYTLLLALVYFAALVSRNPHVLLPAQFWAEDGSIFYQQAHHLGFVHTLVVPYAGYLHLFPRLVAGVSLFAPLSFAPLVFNLAALTAQCLPAIYLCSSRMQELGPLRLRVLLAFLYVGVPNVAKIHGNLTNAQWHLAVLSFLILIALPPKSLAATVFDVTALLLGALTGPFCILLMPVAVLVATVRRERWRTKQIGILSAGAVIQGVTLMLNGRPHMQTGLGASLSRFSRILAFQVFVPVFRGTNNSAEFARRPLLLLVLSYLLTALGLAVLTYVFVRGGLEIRCMLLFAAVVLAASLASPLASPNEPQWEALQRPGSTHRYWYVPELAVAAATVWIATMRTHKILRIAGAVLVGIMILVDVVNWRLPALPNLHFDAYADTFQSLPVGSAIRIPISPSGWFVELTKTERDEKGHGSRVDK